MVGDGSICHPQVLPTADGSVIVRPVTKQTCFLCHRTCASVVRERTCQDQWKFHFCNCCIIVLCVLQASSRICRRYTDEGTDKDFEKVIKDLDKTPGDPSTTKMKLQYEEMRITCKTGIHNLHSDMNDRESGDFHT